MVFSSTIFIFYFLPIVLVLYFAVNTTLKNTVLLISSLIFYAWGEPRFIFILLVSIGANYCFGLSIEKSYSRKIAKVLVVLGVGINLGILFYFKYFNFSISIFNRVVDTLNVGKDHALLSIALPIGLSFFTFQGLSYLIDVYRKIVPAEKNPFHLALYIALFPQLIAGPIVRYQDIHTQLKERNVSLERTFYGLQRFMIGLSKKVMIADILASVADKIFDAPILELTPSTAWLGALCYTMQIYFDFSGYSDMAIGLGKIFGFDFLENFRLPYCSVSMTEFWRRWHISLSTWFRDYLYIPMGGNRRGNVYLHLLIVFLCTGLWHGAAFTFVLWGLWHGAFLLIERMFRTKKLNMPFLIPKFLMWLYTMMAVVIGWVIFRSPGIHYAITYLNIMFGNYSNGFRQFNIQIYLDNQIITAFIIGVLLSIGVGERVLKYIQKNARIFKFYSYLRLPVVEILFLLSALMVANGNYSPFIYFRF